MDNILLILLFCIACAFILAMIRKQMPDFALIASLCAGCILFFYLMGDVTAVISHITAWGQKANLNGQWLTSIIKICGIAFIGQWGIQFCRDAGENSLADKLETAVKISVFILCIPYIDQLFELALRIE